jgi:parallel beta-helix repeat protein
MRSLRLVFPLLFAAAAANAGTFTVTNTNASGAGSLFQAITDLNASTSSTNTINFSIGSGPVSIRQPGSFAPLYKPVIIDGTTQPGYSGTPIVELDGSGCYAAGVSGCIRLYLKGGNSTVKGLVVNNYSNHNGLQGLGTAAGVSLASANNTVVNCFIGTDLTGMSTRQNDVGIRIENGANNNTIGTGAGSWATRNLITGNDRGIETTWGSAVSTTGTTIRGNWVGTSASGVPLPLSNYWGVYLDKLGGGTVGGTQPGDGNLFISRVGLAQCDNVKFQGNHFGVSGTITYSFITLGFSNGNVIGGTAPGAGNTFTWLNDHGVSIQDGSNNTVQGNTFTNVDNGIYIYASFATAEHNVVGGTADGAGNTFNGLRHSGWGAVTVFGATGSSILRNTIVNNAGLGIDLEHDGVTLNDSGDGDGGGNNRQNFPVITAASSGNGTTTIAGTLNSTPFGSYRIELFSNSSCNASGYGSSETYLGSLNTTTDGSGNASFLITLNTTLPVGRSITATATDSGGNTSEFSHCTSVTDAGVLAFASSSASAGEGAGTASVTVNRFSGSNGTVTVNYSTANGSATSGSDYTATSSTLTFGTGETSKSISIPILQDNVYEGNETFSVTLSSPGGGALLASPATATVTITDDDVPSRATIADAHVTEGNSGTVNATFNVALSPAPTAPASVAWTTNPGTAGAADFAAANGTLNFAAGETQKTITVAINGDTFYEPDETFTVALSNPVNILIDRAVATGTITNDDPQPVISADDVVVAEGNGAASITIKLKSSQPITSTINFATQDGSALGSSDYVAANGSLAFNNETEKQFSITIIGDSMPEGDEQFKVRLSSSDPALLFAHPDVVVTITNDDMGIVPSNLTLGTGQSGNLVVDVGNSVNAAQTLGVSASSACIKVPASVDIAAGKHSAAINVTALTAPCNARVEVKLTPFLGGGTLSAGVHTYQTIDLDFDPASPQLYVGQSITVVVKTVPFVEPMTLKLNAGSLTVEVPPSVDVHDANGGTFTMRAIRSGPIFVEVTLPAQYGGAKVPLTGTVGEAPPTVTIFDVAPKSGAQTGGTPVMIEGNNFTPDCTVAFDGAAASNVAFGNASLLTANTPAHKPGVVDVTATCSGTKATLTNGFVYTGGSPDITSIDPASGTTAGGTTVRIGGRDLVSDCWVEFGGDLARSVQVVSATEMIATTPAHAAGAVTVKLRCNGGGAAGSLPNGFTYVATLEPSTVVTTVDPLSAAPGAQVTVRGTHFHTTDVVTFDNAQAQVLSTSPDTHVVVVPTLPAGKVSVNVAGSTTGPIFTVLDPVAPKVTKISPPVVPPNAELTIDGSGFRSPYAFTIGGVVARLVSESYTRAVVRVPPLASGEHELVIVNAGNVVATGGRVTVSPTGIVVYGAAPQCIPIGGGATISISGTGFLDGAAVTIGGVAAAKTTVVDATHIDAVTPPLPPGFATIVVTNPSGDNGTATNAVRAYSPLDPDGCAVAPRPRAVRH